MGPQSSQDELRTMTALFADIVGSTSLSERLPPDEVKALIGECVSRMSRAVEDHGGTIQAYEGDGICAYFGVPAAHEEDPERAARAGLQILGMVQAYAADVRAVWGVPDFNVRVGINTGDVGVGPVGSTTPQTLALGDSTNVAARLQSLAEPGTILVGGATAKLLGPSFALESVGDLQVKGRASPVSAFRLLGSRMTGDQVADRTPLVGREAETARLRMVIDEVVAGRGQVLLLSGEAGLGKTRLLAELRSMVGQRATWLQGRCFGYSPGVLSRPFVDMLRHWLGLGDNEPEVAIRVKLQARLGRLLGEQGREVIPPLGRLLSERLEPPGLEPFQPGSPEADWQAIRGSLRTWIQQLAEAGPVVLALDDFHWATPWTRALAESLLPFTDRAALLVTVAFRPDPNSEAWPFRIRALSQFSHRCVELPIGPLPEAAGHRMVKAIAPPDSLDEAVVEGIVHRAEGNPLFLAEFLRALLESGGESRDRSWTLSASRSHVLPASLESLFVARIDALPPGARKLLQLAAAIGRDFPIAVLERIAESETFREDLEVLLRSGLIHEVRRYPQFECAFKHGLAREAALSLLTTARLRELYGQIAAVTEELSPKAVMNRPEMLAYYYYRSDTPQRAIPHLERAGERAAAIEDRAAAMELWERAERLAAKAGDEATRQRMTGHRRRLEEAASRGTREV
jgi:class 3 adenylate cyclase/predicted ATPase